MASAEAADARGVEPDGSARAPSRVIDGLRAFGLGSFDVYLDTPGLLKSLLLTAGMLVFLERTGEAAVALSWPVGLAIIAFTPAVILLHEFGHAAVARACGLPVRHVVVSGFGGHTALERSHDRGSCEAAIFLAGPATVSVLAAAIWWGSGLFTAAYGAAGEAFIYYAFPLALIAGPGNLIPVFPLDGAGVLRALLRTAGLDPVAATRGASLGGRMAYFAMLAGAVGLAIEGSHPHLAWGGLIFLLLVFPRPSLDAAYTVGAGFALTRVADVLSAPIRVSPGASAAELLRWFTLRAYSENPADRRPLVVMDESGQVFGFLPLSYLREIASMRLPWSRLTASDIMLPLAELPSVSLETPGETAIVYMSEYEVDSLLVMNGGEPAGCVRLDHLVEAAERGRERRAA